MTRTPEHFLSRHDFRVRAEDIAEILRELAAILDTARKPLVPDVMTCFDLMTTSIVDAMRGGVR